MTGAAGQALAQPAAVQMPRQAISQPAQMAAAPAQQPAFAQQGAAAPPSFGAPGQAAATAGTFRLERGTKDTVIGIVGAAGAGYVLNTVLASGSWDGYAMFWAGFAALALLAFAAVILDTFAGKAKFIADQTGLRTESLLGNYHMRWEDLAGFDTMTFNYVVKITQAKATKAGKKTSSSRLNVPRKAFKSREFAQMLAAYRPDLMS